MPMILIAANIPKLLLLKKWLLEFDSNEYSPKAQINNLLHYQVCHLGTKTNLTLI